MFSRRSRASVRQRESESKKSPRSSVDPDAIKWGRCRKKTGVTSFRRTLNFRKQENAGAHTANSCFSTTTDPCLCPGADMPEQVVEKNNENEEIKMNTKQALKKINGVDVDRLFGTIDDIKKTATIAKFKFRVRNQWIDCGHNRSEVRDFYGAGQDIDHLETFVLDADEAEILLGEDKGPNPVEYLLHALAACV